MEREKHESTKTRNHEIGARKHERKRKHENENAKKTQRHFFVFSFLFRAFVSPFRAFVPSCFRAFAAILLVVLCGSVLLAQQKPDRTHPPKPAAPPALKLPPVQKHKLSNGLAVWIVEQHEVPVAQINVIIRAGSAVDPPGKFGVASMTAAMLDEGAGTRSALELADAIEFLGANLSTTSSFDYSAVRTSAPVARLGETLPLVADVVMRPSFPSEELERLRKERLTALLQARDNPAAIAQIAFPRIVFGQAHRYGTTAGGTAVELEAMTLDDVRAFHRAYYRPENATVIAAGDVTPENLLPQLEKTFGRWKAAGDSTKMASVPAAPQLTTRQIYLIDKPGAAQSQIRIGWVGVPRATPDYAVIEVLNTTLGGSFTSRLNQNLREKHGYSYGASSFFDMRLAPGPFFAAAGVQTDKTAEALREFFNEFAGILKPIPAEEVEKAKNYVALGLPAEFETSGDLARKVEELIVYGLPDEYFPSFVRAVTQVTAADVAKAAAKYIQPDKFAVLVVGDRKVIEPGIRALNLGSIEVMTLDQALGPMSR
jgi:zinc protease